MSNLIQTSLILKKETLYDKIRKSLFIFIYQKDYEMMQRLDRLITPKRPNPNQIIIPKEIKY